MPATVKLLEGHFLGQGVDKHAQNPIKWDPWPLLVLGRNEGEPVQCFIQLSASPAPCPRYLWSRAQCGNAMIMASVYCLLCVRHCAKHIICANSC